MHFQLSTAQCPPLGPLGNGTISYSMERNPDFDTGTVATHVCNFGFVLVRMQDRTRICQGTHDWSGEPPMCQRKSYSYVQTLIPGITVRVSFFHFHKFSY